MDVRMATSLLREAARASRRLATLAQAIRRTKLTAPRRGPVGANVLYELLLQSDDVGAVASIEDRIPLFGRLVMPTISVRACCEAHLVLRRPMDDDTGMPVAIVGESVCPWMEWNEHIGGLEQFSKPAARIR